MTFETPLMVTIGRDLTCISCGTVTPVLEICHGATTDEEHQWIKPAEFVCGQCLEEAGELTVAA